jgi:hypothetical protein
MKRLTIVCLDAPVGAGRFRRGCGDIRLDAEELAPAMKIETKNLVVSTARSEPWPLDDQSPQFG